MSCDPARHRQLIDAGWVRQFTASEPRLSEAVENYGDLGFEVHLESVDPAACQGEGQCTACFDSPEAAQNIKIIYTRKPTNPDQDSPQTK